MEQASTSKSPATPVTQEHRALYTTLWRWLDENIFELGREMRLSYLPPLMVYMAAGISGLTAIVGTFFVKDYLGLSASFDIGRTGRSTIATVASSPGS